MFTHLKNMASAAYLWLTSHHKELLSELSQNLHIYDLETALLKEVYPLGTTQVHRHPYWLWVSCQCEAGSSGLPCDQMMHEVSWDGHRYSWPTSHQASALLFSACINMLCMQYEVLSSGYWQGSIKCVPINVPFHKMCSKAVTARMEPALKENYSKY